MAERNGTETTPQLVQELVDLVTMWQAGNGSVLTDLANETRGHRGTLAEIQRDVAVARQEMKSIHESLLLLWSKFDACFEHRQLRYNDIIKTADDKIKTLTDDFKKFKDTEFASIRNRVVAWGGGIAILGLMAGYAIGHYLKAH